MAELLVMPTRAQQLEELVAGLPVRVVLPGKYWTLPCPACSGTMAISWRVDGGLRQPGEILNCWCICGTSCEVLAESLGLPSHAIEEPRPAAISPVWLEDFLLEPIPPPRWLLAPYLQAETVCILFSAPNVGKTVMAFHTMCQLAMTGKVLALEGEGSRGAFQRRLHRAAAAVGGVPSKRFATLHTEVMSLLDPKHEAVIGRWAKGYDCTMIDSLSVFTAGVDENDPVGMSLVGASLKRIRKASGGTVFGLHHSTKTAWKPGDTPSLASLRGHSALAGMVDTALALVPAEAPEGYVAFDVHVVKQRDEEKVKPRRYTVHMRGEVATVEVEELEAPSITKAGNADAHLALKVLEFIRAAGSNGVSGNKIEMNVEGSTDRIRLARLALKQAGTVVEIPWGRFTRWVFAGFAEPRSGELHTFASPNPVLRTGSAGEPERVEDE